MAKGNLIKGLILVFYFVSSSVNGQDEYTKLKLDMTDTVCECLNNSIKSDSFFDDFNNMIDKCIEESFTIFTSQFEALKDTTEYKLTAYQRGRKMGEEITYEVTLLLIEKCDIFYYHMNKQREASFIRSLSNDEENEITTKIKQQTFLIEANPSFKNYMNRGMNNIELNNYELALQDFNDAVTLDSENFMGYLYRGLSLEMLGEYQKALDDYKKAYEINPIIEFEMNIIFMSRKLRDN